MANIPTSNNLSDILKSTVETNTSTIKTIIKGQAYYAASIIAIPLYFRAVGKLYGGYAKFATKNLMNAAKIVMASKIINSSLTRMTEMNDKLNVIITTLQTPKVYKKSTKAVNAMMDLAHTIVNALSGELSQTKNLFRSKKRTIVTVQQLVKSALNVGIYIATLKIFNILAEQMDKIVTTVGKLGGIKGWIRMKLARKGIENMQELTGRMIEFLNSEIIQGISITRQFKTTLKIISLGSSIITLTATLSIVGYMAPVAVAGSIALRIILWSIQGMFGDGTGKTGSNFNSKRFINIRRSLKAFNVVLTLLAGLCTTIISEKIIENLKTIATGIDVKQTAIGMAVIFGLSVSMVITMYTIQLISGRLKSNKLKVVIEMITGFITAWAAAKIADTIAPIGQKAGEVFLGMAVITGITVGMIGLMYLIDLLSGKLKSDKIKVVVDLIVGFITAWAAAKIAETVAPIASMAGEVLIGMGVICAVMLMVVSTLRLIDIILKKSHLIKVAIGLVVISFATLVAFTTLAFAAIFAPFAIISMGALVAVSLMAALIGIFWKSILKGALAMAILGIALNVIAAPLLIFGITGAILAAACGSPDMVLAVSLSLVGMVAAFAMLAALVGAFIEPIVIGSAGLLILGIAMLSIAVPLLIFAISLEKLSKLEMDEDAFASIIRMMANGVKEIFNQFLYLNPITLYIATSSMFAMLGMVISVGMMADVLQHIASLSIPTEWNSKGKPTAYTRMNEGDFEKAATNACTIISFFSAIFSDKDTELPNGVVIHGVLGNIEGIKRKHRRKMRRLRKMVRSVGDMAVTLQQVASLKIPIDYDNNGKPTGYRQMTLADFKQAAINCGTIVRFFSLIFNDKDTVLPNGVVVHGLLGDIENIKRKHKRKLKRLNKMVETVGNMAITLQNVAMLKVPTEYNEDGKPTGWVTMNETHFRTAAHNISVIATTLIGALASEDLTKTLKDMDSDVAENFEHILTPIGNIGVVLDIVKQLGEDKYVKTWKTDSNGNQIPDTYGSFTELMANAPVIQQNISSLLDVIISPLAEYNNDKEDMLHDAKNELNNVTKVISGGSDIVESLVRLYNEHLANLDVNDYRSKWSIQLGVTSAMIKRIGGEGVKPANIKLLAKNIDKTTALIKRIDSVNPDKLKTASDLMKHISDLSASIRGNFEGLAKAINEDLLDALEKLTGKLDDISNGNINVTAQASTPGDIISKPSGSAGVKDTKESKHQKQPQSVIKPEDIRQIKEILTSLSANINSIMDHSTRSVRVVDRS